MCGKEKIYSSSMAGDGRKTLRAPPPLSPELSQPVAAVRCHAEWQAVLLDISWLNRLLGEPIPGLSIAQVLHSSSFHSLWRSFFKLSGSQDHSTCRSKLGADEFRLSQLLENDGTGAVNALVVLVRATVAGVTEEEEKEVERVGQVGQVMKVEKVGEKEWEKMKAATTTTATTAEHHASKVAMEVARSGDTTSGAMTLAPGALSMLQMDGFETVAMEQPISVSTSPRGQTARPQLHLNLQQDQRFHAPPLQKSPPPLVVHGFHVTDGVGGAWSPPSSLQDAQQQMIMGSGNNQPFEYGRIPQQLQQQQFH